MRIWAFPKEVPLEVLIPLRSQRSYCWFLRHERAQDEQMETPQICDELPRIDSLSWRRDSQNYRAYSDSCDQSGQLSVPVQRNQVQRGCKPCLSPDRPLRLALPEQCSCVRGRAGCCTCQTLLGSWSHRSPRRRGG